MRKYSTEFFNTSAGVPIHLRKVGVMISPMAVKRIPATIPKATVV